MASLTSLQVGELGLIGCSHWKVCVFGGVWRVFSLESVCVWVIFLGAINIFATSWLSFFVVVKANNEAYNVINV